MVYRVDYIFYSLAKTNPQLQIYDGIFFPELFCLFINTKDEEIYAYYFFDKCQPVLIFPKSEEQFISDSIESLKDEISFLIKIKAINLNPIVQKIILTTNIKNLLDEQSKIIWIYSYEYNFIKKYLIPNLIESQIDQKFWLKQLEYKTSRQQISDPYHFYVFDLNNKNVLPRDVSADIVNDINIHFCLGHNSDLTISKKKLMVLKHRLPKGLILISSFKDPFPLFFLPPPDVLEENKRIKKEMFEDDYQKYFI